MPSQPDLNLIGKLRLSRKFNCAALLAVTVSHTATTQAQETEPDDGSTIIVIGERLIIGIPPEEVLGEEQIEASAKDTIGSLLNELSQAPGRSANDVIYLVDGERVADISEIETYPTEVIEKLEIYPSGSAPRAGGTAEQRVVNIALKPSVKIGTARIALSAATEGGFIALDNIATFTRIARPSRLHATANWQTSDAILESERDVQQELSAPANLGDFRTLRPSQDQYGLRASYTNRIADGILGTIAGGISNRTSLSRLGLTEDSSQLTQRIRTRNINFTGQVSGQIDAWQLLANAAYHSTRNLTATNALGAESDELSTIGRTSSGIDAVSGAIQASRAIAELPAGPVSFNIRANFSSDTIETNDVDFTQRRQEIGGGISFPITARALAGFDPLGGLSFGIDGALGDTNNAGTFYSIRSTFGWRPTQWLNVIGSWREGRVPPSTQLLAAPLIETPGVRYLDPLLGQDVEVTQITGGNAELQTQTNRDLNLSLQITPTHSVLKRAAVDFSRRRNRDLITTLPVGSSLLFAAFPDRFIRDDLGQLIVVDTRAVNFAEQRDDQLRYALQLGWSLGQADDGKAEAFLTGKRIALRFSHQIRLQSDLLVAPDFDSVNLLSPNALGLGGVGQPRHELDASIQFSQQYLVIEANARYRSEGFVNLISGTDQNSLRFSPLATFDLTATVDGRAIASSSSWLNGTRFGFRIANLFNDRETVRNSAGVTPLLFQQPFRDPTGRLVEFSVRKRF